MASWTRQRLATWRKAQFGVALALTFLLAVPAGAWADGKLLVYTGNGAVNEGYSQFAAASGRLNVTSSTFPVDDADFDQYKCIVLPVTRTGFTTVQRSALTGYMDRGGTILTQSLEHLQVATDMGPASEGTFKALASSTGIRAFNTTVTFDATFDAYVSASRYTAGVSQVGYAAATTLTVTAPAQTLVMSSPAGQTDPPPAPLVAVRDLGAGKFVFVGDSNIFSDGSGGFYTGNDNAHLANNLCGDITPPVIAITTPAQGARYKRDQVVQAVWGCTDAGSDIATTSFQNGLLSGTISGLPIETTVAPGQTVTKSFSVACADAAGNVAPTKTVTYEVDDSKPTSRDRFADQ